MNLDKQGPVAPADLAAPPDWTMEVMREQNAYIAILMRANIVICRISMVTSNDDEAAARTLLANKCRQWIRDYLSRPPQGK